MCNAVFYDHYSKSSKTESFPETNFETNTSDECRKYIT